jgi:hypothetical protein
MKKLPFIGIALTVAASVLYVAFSGTPPQVVSHPDVLKPDASVENLGIIIPGNCDAASNPFGPIKPGCSPIIPFNRLLDWSKPGVTYNGGIPARTTVCATVNPNGLSTGDSNAISSAIASCPAGQTVMLSAGTYNFALNDDFAITNSNVTLRGTVDGNGRPTSVIAVNSQFTPIQVVNLYQQEGDTYLCAQNALTSDGTKGSFTIQLTSTVAYSVGELVTINQLYDPAIWWYDNYKFGTNVLPPGSTTSGSPGTETNRNLFTEWDRPEGEVHEVAAVSGTTLTFSTPLHDNFLVANQAHVARHSGAASPTCTPITAPITGVGIENLYLYGVPTDGGASTEGNGFVSFLGVKNSWMKNIEAYNWQGVALSISRCFRCEMRDSYIHQTEDPNPGGGGYAMAMDWQTTDSLAENNIMWAVNKVQVMRSTGGGNVFGYNYMEDGFGAGYPTQPETGANASHFMGSHYELFEGNQVWNLSGDSVWGNEIYIVFFRNHATGLRRNQTGVTSAGAYGTPMNFQHDYLGRTMVNPGPFHLNYTFVGNVLGSLGQYEAGTWNYNTNDSNPCQYIFPGIWNLGTDGNSLSADAGQCSAAWKTALIHGDYWWGPTDAGDAGIQWEAGIANEVIPNSLYLSGVPAFFGANSWPWVNPYTGIFATCSGDTYCLPARIKFDTMVAAGTSPCSSCLWRN